MPTRLPDRGWSMTKGGVAMVTEADGTMGDGATGIYVRDRRIVAGMRLRIDGEAPVQLSGARLSAGADRLTYGYWTDAPDPQAVILRERSLDDGYHEKVTVQCFRRAVTFTLNIELDPGGATVYHLEGEAATDRDVDLVASIVWVDGCSVDGLTVSAAVAVEPGEEITFSWGLRSEIEQPRPQPATSVAASSSRLQRALHGAQWDLEALTVIEPRTQRPFLAAGSPHFLALFGRDALIASLFTMLASTDRALNTLEVLAEYQGTSHDDDTLEAPGRILHELRIGEMGVFGLDPGVPYYGSVDSTPLFVILLTECLHWGEPSSRLKPLLGPARAALEWCRSHVDRFGFVRSEPHDAGIGNQGWKDSGDSIVRPDGSVVRETTSLVEVQGYFHQALLGLADLEESLGDPGASAGLRKEAADLAVRFREHFLVGPDVHVALALDATGDPVAVRASNVGHLLAGELIDDTTARCLARRLLSPEEFSGWGIRTLSADEAAFNPLGYHVGTVWPHDNAAILRGFTSRGFADETVKLSRALIDLAAAEQHTLPELVGGFDRADFAEPTPYPMSARPQAWAAAVPFQIVTALLGFRPALHRNEIRLRPLLEPHETITLDKLRLGNRTIRVQATGHEISVTGDIDGLDIIVER